MVSIGNPLPFTNLSDIEDADSQAEPDILEMSANVVNPNKNKSKR